MFAVVVRLEVPEGATIEQGRQMLETEVVPEVKKNPGFIAGYWLAPVSGREALTFVIFENEQSARAAADRVRVPEPVTLLNVEVREVAASA